MSRIILFLLIGSVFLSCKREKDNEGILTETEMVNVLMQMYLAEEQFSKISIPYDSASTLIPYFRSKVFEKVGVDESVYKKSMEFYLADPKRLEFIYTALVDSLSLREQSKPNEYTQYASPQ